MWLILLACLLWGSLSLYSKAGITGGLLLPLGIYGVPGGLYSSPHTYVASALTTSQSLVPDLSLSVSSMCSVILRDCLSTPGPLHAQGGRGKLHIPLTDLGALVAPFCFFFEGETEALSVPAWPREQGTRSATF